jgi:hypothetical protein
VIVDGDRQHLLGMVLTDDVVVEDLADLFRRYFRFGWERTFVNRMPDACKIGVEVNPKVVLGKPIIRGTSRYPARARSGAS